MGIDNDALNNAIGDSRHWPSGLRLLRGLLSIVCFIGWLVCSIRAIELLPNVATLFKAPGIPLTAQDGKFMVYFMLFLERVVQVAMWILMYIAQLFVAKGWFEMSVVVLAVGTLAYFLISRFSQDSERAATKANNDDESSDDE